MKLIREGERILLVEAETTLDEIYRIAEENEYWCPIDVATGFEPCRREQRWTPFCEAWGDLEGKSFTLTDEQRAACVACLAALGEALEKEATTDAD